MDGSTLLCLGLFVLGFGILKILSEESGPLYINSDIRAEIVAGIAEMFGMGSTFPNIPPVMEDPRTVKVKVTEPSQAAKEAQKQTEFNSQLRHFRLFDIGIVAYGKDKQVYLLRNVPKDMPIYYIQPFVEIGLYRTEEVRIEFQILDADQRLVAVDSVVCQFPGKKAILTPSPRAMQYFKDVSVKNLTLEILIYDHVLCPSPFYTQQNGRYPS